MSGRSRATSQRRAGATAATTLSSTAAPASPPTTIGRASISEPGFCPITEAKAPSWSRCRTRPSSWPTPTLESACGVGMPERWRKRVFSATPPTPPGETILTKEPATWASVACQRSSRSGTNPTNPMVAARWLAVAARTASVIQPGSAPARVVIGLSSVLKNGGSSRQPATTPPTTATSVRGRSRSSRIGPTGACGRARSTSARMASSSSGCCLRAARVPRASAIGWSSGRAAPTGPGPSAATAERTARSAPARRARVVSSCAVSALRTSSLAAMSPSARPTRCTAPSSAIRTASGTSARCEISRVCRRPNWVQASASSASVISSSASRSRVRPGTCSYATRAASGPSSALAATLRVRTPAATAAYETSASCSRPVRSERSTRGCGAVRSRSRRQTRWNSAATRACRSSSSTSRSGRPSCCRTK